MAALAGLLFGLDIGVISGALPFIAKEYALSDTLQEWIVSSMMVGAAFGAVGAGWLSWRMRRRYSLGLAAAMFVAGSVWSALAGSPESLIGARLLLGSRWAWLHLRRRSIFRKLRRGRCVAR
jgi:SP family galactose:H+ symporter-like MFS transporter